MFRTQVQGLFDQKWNKYTAEIFFWYFFDQKFKFTVLTIYKTWNFLTFFLCLWAILFLTFCILRIRIHWPDCESGYNPDPDKHCLTHPLLTLSVHSTLYSSIRSPCEAGFLNLKLSWVAVVAGSSGVSAPTGPGAQGGVSTAAQPE